ncbi:RNA polymerase sigma factor [Flagellimonas sp. 2504JD4-2]
MRATNIFDLQPAKWVERYSDCLAIYASARVPQNMVQDIVQETFYSGLKSAKTYKSKAKERTWLISILNHKIIDYYRRVNSKKGKVNEKLFLEADYNDGSVNQFADLKLDVITGEIVYQTKELMLIVEQGLIGLPKSERSVFKLRFHGYSTPEICQILEISENYCWVLMCKAKSKIRDYVAKNGYEVA